MDEKGKKGENKGEVQYTANGEREAYGHNMCLINSDKWALLILPNFHLNPAQGKPSQTHYVVYKDHVQAAGGRKALSILKSKNEALQNERKKGEGWITFYGSVTSSGQPRARQYKPKTRWHDVEGRLAHDSDQCRALGSNGSMKPGRSMKCPRERAGC